jgi:nucleoid-associated protein YgaU
MKRIAVVLIPLLFFAVIPVFAQAPSAEPGAAVSRKILNNDYYVQSLRLTGLARHSYEAGDYDASTAYAEEAQRYARLSDEYVADHALGAAEARLRWAASAGVNAGSRYPQAYRAAEAAYAEAGANHAGQKYRETIAAANQVFEALSVVSAAVTGASGAAPLPARYTVRSWTGVRDCLWNIAGRPWVYGDPRQWRRLYNANKDRFPEPDNPNLVEPGMVLEIPSIRGETRQGAWSPGAAYPPLR